MCCGYQLLDLGERLLKKFGQVTTGQVKVWFPGGSESSVDLNFTCNMADEYHGRQHSLSGWGQLGALVMGLGSCLCLSFSMCKIGRLSQRIVD